MIYVTELGSIQLHLVYSANMCNVQVRASPLTVMVEPLRSHDVLRGETTFSRKHNMLIVVNSTEQHC